MPKNTSNKSFSASNFGQKSPRGQMSISTGVELGGSKDDTVYILNCTETENCIHFWAERCQKYAIFRKKLQIKVLWHQILDKNVRKGICLSSPWSELGTSEDDMVDKSEYIFPFLYNLIFKQYFLSPLAPLRGGGGRHMLSWTFLSEIRCQKTFI